MGSDIRGKISAVNLQAALQLQQSDRGELNLCKSYCSAVEQVSN